MLDRLSHTSTQLVSTVLSPFSGSPWLALALCGALLGVLSTLALRRFTPRQRLAKLRKETRAELLAWRLFADQLSTWRTSPLRLLRLAALRCVLCLPGALLLAPLAYACWWQLDLHFARRPLSVGERAIVTVQWPDEMWREAAAASLQTGRAATIVSGPLRDAVLHESYWSLEAMAPEPAMLELKYAGGSTSWPLTIAAEPARLTPVDDSFRVAISAKSNSAPPPGGEALHVHIDYPPRHWSVFSWRGPWWLAFLVVYSVAAWLTAWFLPSKRNPPA